MDKPKDSENCFNHPTEKAKYCCLTCKKILCLECKKNCKNNHHDVDICEDVYEELVKKALVAAKQVKGQNSNGTKLKERMKEMRKYLAKFEKNLMENLLVLMRKTEEIDEQKVKNKIEELSIKKEYVKLCQLCLKVELKSSQTKKVENCTNEEYLTKIGNVIGELKANLMVFNEKIQEICIF